MFNILFSNSCKRNCWGGVEKWVIMMADQLQRKGYDVHLVCRSNSLIEKAAHQNNINTHPAHFFNSLDFSTSLKIQKIIRTYGIDVVICSTNLDIKLAGIAGRVSSIPVIARQGLALIPNNIRYRILVRNLVTSIFTNTITIKKQYEAYGWFPENFIQVIYNGVEDYAQKPYCDCRTKYMEPSDDKLILSVGRLNSQKGFDYLIKAAKLAQDKGKHWKFIVLGDGEEKKNLEKMIQDLKVKNVRLLGFQKNVYDFYRNSDIFVLSSLAEGTPNVVLEAMSAQCPVIATAVNGVNEIIKNKFTGWTVPSRDEKAIFETLEKNIDKKNILMQISKNAHQMVQKKFTIEQSLNHFVEYITQTIAKYEKNHHKNT